MVTPGLAFRCLHGSFALGFDALGMFPVATTTKPILAKIYSYFLKY